MHSILTERDGSRPGALFSLLLIAALGLFPAAGSGQAGVGPAAAAADRATPALDVPTAAQVEARIQEVENAADLDAAQKKTALKLYRSARRRLIAAEEFRARAKVYAGTIDLAPKMIADIRATLDGPLVVPKSEEELLLPDGATLSQIEPLLVKARAELATLNNRLSSLDRQLQAQRTRPVAARQRQAVVTEEQRKAEELIGKAAEPGAPSAIQAARRVFALARWQMANDELIALAQELASYNTRMELDSAKREVFARDRTRMAARVKLLESIVNRGQRAAAEQAKADAETAERAAVGKHPLVRKLAEANAELSRELAAVVEAQVRESAELAKVSARGKEFDRRFESARRRLEIAGLSTTLGQILLNQRKRLRGVGSDEKAVKRRRNEIVAVGLAQLRVVERRRALDDPPAVLAQLLRDELGPDLLDRERQWIEAEARLLLQDEQELLEKLAVAYTDRTRTLGDLDFEQRQLIARAELFSAFLDRNLLWIPSAPPLGSWILGRGTKSVVAWFLEGRRWSGVAATLVRDAREQLTLWAGFVILVLATLRLGRRFERWMEGISKRVGRVQTDRFALTVQALGVTVLTALPWPLALAFLGWRLEEGAGESVLSAAAGGGLVVASELFILLRAFSVLCHPRGIAAIHFRWPEPTLALIRGNLAWFLPVAVPIAFLGVTMAGVQAEVDRGGLGRMALMAILVALAVFLYRMLHPRTGIFVRYEEHTPDSWLMRLRFLWFPLLVGLPLGLAGLGGIGYVFTAASLTLSLLTSIALLAAAFVVRALLLRWLAVAQRQLRLLELKEKRRAELAAREAAGEHAADDGPEVPPEVPEFDLERIDAQTRQLLDTLIGFGVIVGLWLVWSDVVPALEVLDEVALWEQVVTVGGKAIGQVVSLADVGLAVIIAAIVVVAARNLPGALELALLRRLSLEPGVRFAFATISQYVIVAVGVFAAFNAIGIGWSKVQWLVAAVSVGLGFGLQEIFANFVSGLIILFERPIRIGDTVTVGEVTGTVTRIQIRATTITDWDNKEIIVPNKTFITGQLTNWSLTDRIVRVVIRVGIAYGSDTELAHRLMLAATRTDPLVLDEPAPTVYFIGLGESSLDFDVRLYVKQTSDQFPVRHSFHMAIEKKLREHGIEIPFPQRDIHVRTVVAGVGTDGDIVRGVRGGT